MTTKFADPVPVPTEPPAPPIDPIGLVLADHLRELIYTGATTSERSLQKAVGVSEIGADCQRQLAYKIAGVPPTNIDSDPMPSIIGTGFHMHVQKMIERLDPRRYLVETPVTWRGIPGTVDLYDRRRRLVVDWKSTSKAKLRRLRADGPPMRARVQVQIYAQALAQLGEAPERVALAYVPRDGSLDELWVWSAPLDRPLVDTWLLRYEELVRQVTEAGIDPGAIPAKPSRLCSYCDHYSTGSTEPSRACPGLNP